MNPHDEHKLSLISCVNSIVANLHLIVQMIQRGIIGKYKGSIMGVFWSFLTPILMLLVYTFVFSTVFKAKWSADDLSVIQPKSQFAIILFIGMIVHSLFAEAVNSSTSLILSNSNFVKKVVFPLEILPVIQVGVSLFACIINLVVLILALMFMGYELHWTIFFIPIVLLPILFLTLGFSWFLSSLGVFVRDINQPVIIMTTIMMFLAPVFFPMNAIPNEYHMLILLNPLTFIIEQARAVLIWGQYPNVYGLFVYYVTSILVAWAGYAWFQKTRKGFADVI